MTDLEELTKKVVKFRNTRNWKQYHSPKNQAIGLMIEAAEFLEVFNYSLNHRIPKNQKRHFEEELIDVLYWVLLIAHDNKIDIKKAFEQKMKKNGEKHPLI